MKYSIVIFAREEYNKQMAVRIGDDKKLAEFRKISISDGSRLYRELRINVIGAGILKRDYFYYILITFLDLSGFIFFIYLFITGKNLLFLTLTCLGISFFAVRIGGLIHDAGHRAIFKSSLANDLYGYVCAYLVALPFSVWKIKHNAHHAHTNETDSDPDLEIPMSFTKEQSERQNFMVRLIRRHQAWLYYPLGSLVSFTLRIKAFKHYLQNFSKKTLFQMILQLSGMFLWYVLPFMVFPLNKALLFFILTNEASGFYMLNIFAPNHKGMPQIGAGLKFSFLEHQIVTSRNIYGHWLTDYVYLGLNYQIEHHLFPDCPRSKLNRITPFVRQLCRRYRLNFAEMGVIESNRYILTDLRNTSRMIK